MVICHVITRMIRGGADENTLLSCNAQAEAGHTVHLIYGREKNDEMLSRLSPDVRLHCAKYLVRSINPLYEILAFHQLYALIKKIDPDVLHTHTSKAGILGRAAARLAGARSIVHGVHILPFLNVGRMERMVYLFLEKALTGVTDAFVNVSEGMRAAGIAHGIGRPEKHVVIPSGMNVDLYRSSERIPDVELRGFFPGEAGMEGIEVVLMVAALEPRKRIVEFLPVFAEVVSHRPLARLVILGEGKDRQRIEARMEELGLVDKVCLLGYRNDVERWIKTASVCVLASEREGLPRVVVQYALGGCPAVVTALPGVDVIVKDEQTGFLVADDSLEEMAGRIIALLKDRSLNSAMRNAIAQLDLSRWSVDHMVRELDKVYLKSLRL